jgi:predicted nucleic acid-binding protein
MMRVLLDTNILLDVFGQREPFYAASARIWALSERGHIDAFISAISFNNCYYVVRKLGSPPQAREVLRWLRDEFSIVPLSERIIHQAIDSDITDFEDAIQFFSAVACSAQAVITRNVGDFPAEGVFVTTPEEFLGRPGQ